MQIFNDNDSIFQKLSKNSSVFTNLNVSTFQVLKTDTMTKLDSMFKLFAGINSNYSGYCKHCLTNEIQKIFFRNCLIVCGIALPNILGKSLCGSNFMLNLESYGYTIKTTTIYMDNSTANATNIGRKSTEEASRPGPNCVQLFNDIRKVGGSVIGNLITPLLFGKILYTPKNNATFKLIQKVNCSPDEILTYFYKSNRNYSSLIKHFNNLIS